MTDEKTDQILRQTLSPIIPDEHLNQNLKREMEAKKMKGFGMKKAIVLAAACCLLVGTVSLASSGKIVTLIAGPGLNTYTSFEQLSRVEEKAGFEIDAVEEFSNGYTFSEMEVSDYTGLDENDTIVSWNKGIGIYYEKTGSETLYLKTEKAASDNDGGRTPEQTMDINGITVNYYTDTCKLTMVEYEVTAEEMRITERRDHNIVNGADGNAENQVSSVEWIKGDVRYMITNLSSVTPAEELFGMAKELIMLP